MRIQLNALDKDSAQHWGATIEDNEILEKMIEYVESI